MFNWLKRIVKQGRVVPARIEPERETPAAQAPPITVPVSAVGAARKAVRFRSSALAQLWGEVSSISHPDYPYLNPRSSAACQGRFITQALTVDRVIRQVPPSYGNHFDRHIEPVRHDFAHGDWLQLERTLAAVDLAQSFLAVTGYLCVIEKNLREFGLAGLAV